MSTAAAGAAKVKAAPRTAVKPESSSAKAKKVDGDHLQLLVKQIKTTIGEIEVSMHLRVDSQRN